MFPKAEKSPFCGTSRPASIFRRVDLPQPLAPRMQTRWPLSMERLKSDSTGSPMWTDGQKTILITRMSEIAAEKFVKDIPFEYYADGKIGIVGKKMEQDIKGSILVITAGTSDIPVAEEAAITAETLGNKVERIYDVGVAGLHRLLSNTDAIMSQETCINGIQYFHGAMKG